MSKVYALMVEEWEYGVNDNAIKELRDKGIYIPCEIDYLRNVCGSLGEITIGRAKEFVEDLKSKWPFVKFNLYEGETWGTLKLVQSY
ncbi:MAG: hypothetical protein K5765_06930 [Clostridia bacterium]|nr:hypothetical protein [Clostridia bacterium]